MNHKSIRQVLVCALLLITLLLANLIAACTVQLPTQSGDLIGDGPVRGASLQTARGFVVNRGQVEEEVHFMAHGLGGAMLFRKSGIGFSMRVAHQDEGFDARAGEDVQNQAIDFRQIFLDASTKTNLRAGGRSSGRINYLLGSDPQQWFTDIPLYQQVIYDDIYPGIDLVYESQEQGVKSTFLVQPWSDPGLIRWSYSPEVVAQLTATGDLRLTPADRQPGTSLEENNLLLENRPIAWQFVNGKKQIVEARYLQARDGSFSFGLDEYHREVELIIDPVMVFSTFWGGNMGEEVTGIKIGNDGDVYLAGSTTSADFPSSGAPIPDGIGGNIYVTRFKADFSEIIYSTILGGTSQDTLYAFDIDMDGSVYLGGYTMSQDFPTTPDLQTIYGGGDADGFFTKLDPTGSIVLLSTFLGGNDYDQISDLDAGEAGQVYLIGSTFSPDFVITQNAYDSTINGWDSVVIRLDTISKSLVYSTFLGGLGIENGQGIVALPDNSVYVYGSTESLDFPTINPYQAALAGRADLFISHVSFDGTELLASTLLGGWNGDYGTDIALDQNANIVVLGSTSSKNFPTVNPIQAVYGSNDSSRDSFLAILNPALNILNFSTFIGSTFGAQGWSLLVDESNNIYFTGDTASMCLPAFSQYQVSHGGQDIIVGKLNPQRESEFLTMYGGESFDAGKGLALDDQGHLFVAGITGSQNFPLRDPIDNIMEMEDAFIVKFDSVQKPQKGPYNLYLPGAFRDAVAGIHGRMLFGGCSSQGTQVALRYFDGVSWSTRATDVTDAGGYYAFGDQPSLQPGELYYVLYQNSQDLEQYLSTYGTASLGQYQSGIPVDMGTSEIHDVYLGSPNDGTLVKMPVEFSWTRRWFTSLDSYELHLIDPSPGGEWWTSPPLGYVSSYTLTKPPSGFAYQTGPYVWTVGVSDPTGGYGFSRSEKTIVFSQYSSLPKQNEAVIQGNVPNDVRFSDPLFVGR